MNMLESGKIGRWSRLLCVLSIVVMACPFISCGRMSDEEYFEKEARKGNDTDWLVRGLKFCMTADEVKAHLKGTGLVNFYKTKEGKERAFMQRLRLEKELGCTLPDFEESFNLDFESDRTPMTRFYEMARHTSEWLPIDYYPYDFAYVDDFVMKVKTGYYDHPIVMGVDVCADRLRSIALCFSGEEVESEEDVDYLPLFKELKTTMTKRFGRPYREDDFSALWVDGITHVTLTYCGVQRSCSKIYRARNYDLKGSNLQRYYPYYVIEFTDYSFEKQIERELAEFEGYGMLDSLAVD